MVTNHYETLLVIETAKTEDEKQAIVDKTKAIIEKEGTIEKLDLWGNRRLAYPINYQTEGYYVVIQFISNPDLPRELDRVYRITDGILRSIIIKRDERYLDMQVKLGQKPVGDAVPANIAAPEASVGDGVLDIPSDTAPPEDVGANIVRPTALTKTAPPEDVGDAVPGVPTTLAETSSPKASVGADDLGRPAALTDTAPPELTSEPSESATATEEPPKPRRKKKTEELAGDDTPPEDVGDVALGVPLNTTPPEASVGDDAFIVPAALTEISSPEPIGANIVLPSTPEATPKTAEENITAEETPTPKKPRKTTKKVTNEEDDTNVE